MAMAPEQIGIGIRRYFTQPGTHPYDTVAWERRDARITNFKDGTDAFYQPDVEFPVTWSQNATNIVAQKYFRGTLGTDEREHSLKQVIDRVADTITAWGVRDGYFVDEQEGAAFRNELKYVLLHQRAAFNSPVWFNIGVKGVPQQASACQPFDALVSTPDGLVPIGELVEGDAVGTKVFDAHGLTKIVAVKHNGRKEVLRIHTKAGMTLDVTPDHLVWKPTGSECGSFVEAGMLRPGDALEWHRAESWGVGEITTREIAEAALAGWLQSDGFVGQYEGTNRSLTIEPMTVTDAEHRWVTWALDEVFGDAHRHERAVETQDQSLDCRRIRLYGEHLREFVERWDLMPRGLDMQVPPHLLTAPLPVVAAYLRSVFQAEGYVSLRERSTVVGLDMISEGIVRGLQQLLSRFGIYARVRFKRDSRPNRKGCWSLAIRVAGDRRRFADEIGFIDERKADKLESSFDVPGRRALPVKRLQIERIEQLGEMDVYDIQTESGEYLSANLRVHNCFILAVEDTMDGILNWYREEGIIFKGGSGSGINLSGIRSSEEQLAGGGTASGPVSFMRGADASAGTIKSGGKTRRAAKMVILDVDHPDVEEFIWCKAREERKARALRDAGFDMDLDGIDSHSIQYQNANNSVRVSDEFMQAVLDDADWDLNAVVTGETRRTLKARDLMRQIAEAAWECADPGMQYDTTINRWHTAPNTGRINASNPCCFVAETLVATTDGPTRFDLLHKTAEAGQPLPSVVSFDGASGELLIRPIRRVWIAGETRKIVEVVTAGGLRLRSTPDHRYLTFTGEYVEAMALCVGQELRGFSEHGEFVRNVVATVAIEDLAEPVVVYDLEVADTHNFGVTSEGAISHAAIIHNSEYMHLDNSACNLASINLLKYLEDDGSFDVEGFKHTVEVMFTAQEILVGNADYPTERIGDTSRRFRQLGLGYANLGALLMAQGFAYDSDDGRAWAGAITALMTGHAYATSARTAGRMGPFAGYAENADAMINVLRMHRAEVAKIDEDRVPVELLGAAQRSWDEAVDVGEIHGVRNSQASVLAPTGTIGLMLDCDTTGIEPDLALTKAKKLVGGGTMMIVNQTIPRALRKLGYSDEQTDEITAYINEHKSLDGAPHFRDEHLPVFACSMGDNTIHYTGHVKMMGAAQPFLSGAISKCVTGDSLVATADGLVRMGSMHRGETADTFREEVLEVASLGGSQKTDAFYYGGHQPVREVVLRSGHRVRATPNHRLLVARDGGVDWVATADLESGDWVAVQYGDDLWSSLPARFDGFTPTPSCGSQKSVRVPIEMTEELAFLLGAYVAEGHTQRRTWSISITNSVSDVLERVVAAWRSEFDVEARYESRVDRCPQVHLASKTIVEFFEYLGCGHCASEKRIPDAILRSPKEMVLAFLQGLALDAYVTTSTAPKWALCVDSPALLDDLQALLTNLGLVHGRVSKLNKDNGKIYDEVYLTGDHAQKLVGLVPFIEPDKATRAERLLDLVISRRRNTADVVPGITPRELYALISDRSVRGAGPSARREFTFLCDDRTRHVTRQTLERVARVPGVALPPWLQTVLVDDLHFSPVERVGDAGVAEVFDLSVPTTHAFVGNGIVNHNTVNTPEETTVEEIEQLYIDSWKRGLKAVAIYRDDCKVAQPLATQKKASQGADADDDDVLSAEVERIVETVIVQQPIRQKLPRTRTSKTFSFRVADCHGYATVGEFEDGRPGEMFLKVAKQGSTLSGIMDAFAISVSLGLQYGVPLRAFVEKFTNMRFEPAGMTDDPDIRFATSLVDYIFRRLAVEYLDPDERRELGILTIDERLQPTLPGVEEAATPNQPARDLLPPEDRAPSDLRRAAPAAPAPPAPVAPQEQEGEVVLCYVCGDIMQRAGSCHACPSCGATSGCS